MKMSGVRAKGNALNLPGPLGWLIMGRVLPQPQLQATATVAASSSSACSHCTLLPPPTKASGTQDTGCLAGTSAQHIQGEPSQISLCYFKPTKDAGPLPHGHKYLTPAYTTLGCFPAPGLVFSQPLLQAGSAVWQVRNTGLGKPAPLSCEGPQSFRTGNKRGQPTKVMGLHVHYTPTRFPGPHQGA